MKTTDEFLEEIFEPLDRAMKPIHEHNEKVKEFNKKYNIK